MRRTTGLRHRLSMNVVLFLLSTAFVNKGRKKSRGWANVPDRVMRLEPACEIGVVNGRSRS
jgi:hypothetical protein